MCFLQKNKNFTSNREVRFKDSCASFYGFSCEFMPEWATWATAGVELASKVDGGPIEFDTWCSPATGTKTLQLLLWCCPGGAEEQLRDALRFMVTLLNRLFEVKTDDILMSCSTGFVNRRNAFAVYHPDSFSKALWSRFFNGSSRSVIHSHNI